MFSGHALELLGNLMVGQTAVTDFADELDEYLFSLRQNPGMTEEKKDLSFLDLVLHEVNEGDRPLADLYTYADAILSKALSVKESATAPAFEPLTLEAAHIEESMAATTTAGTLPTETYPILIAA